MAFYLGRVKKLQPWIGELQIVSNKNSQCQKQSGTADLFYNIRDRKSLSLKYSTNPSYCSKSQYVKQFRKNQTQPQALVLRLKR